MWIMWLSNWIFKFYLILINLSWNRLKWLGFPGGASGEESAYQFRRCRRLRFDPWVGKIPGGGHGNPLQSSCLENSMDRRAWRPAVHRAAKSRTQLKQLSIHACRLVWLVVIPLDNTTWDPQTAYAPSLWIRLVPSFQNQMWWGRYLNTLNDKKFVVPDFPWTSEMGCFALLFCDGYYSERELQSEKQTHIYWVPSWCQAS